MQNVVIQRIIGFLLILFSFTMLPPALVGYIYGDGAIAPFLDSFALMLVVGATLFLPLRNYHKELRLRDGFIVVVLVWVVFGLIGALPLILLETPNISMTDSMFESISALTTSGATVLTNIDSLPHSILFYRQQLAWVGGGGIIVLAVAVLPMLGVGGMQLYRAETPGPMKDSKLTPRITETAKAMWYVYLGLTIVCAVAYWLAGMSGFDAIGHSFATIATAGFSTHDASMGYFNSKTIELVAVVFMILAAINFSLHFIAWRNLNLMGYFQDTEAKAYLVVLGLLSSITIGYLYVADTFDSFGDALHHGVFQTVSMATSTGFFTAQYAAWPGFLPVLLIFSTFIGGCAGSTCGGIKVIRILLLFKQGIREIKLLIHPNALIPVKVGGKPISDRVINAVWGFFSLYVLAFVVLLLTLMAMGMDQVTAFSALAACLNNVGLGLGEVSSNFGSISDQAKWVLGFAMLLGRLEVFTLMVLFTATFWRK